MNGQHVVGNDEGESEAHGPVTIMLVTACTAEWVKETSVKITNVEETTTGHDMVTFVCPRCLGQHQSLRYA